MSDPVCIALVGADVSGKSSAHRALGERFSHRVVVCPEAATILIGELGARPPFEGERLDRFQQAVAGKIEVLERVAVLQARGLNRPAVLCDRGLADGLAYLEGSTSRFQALLGVSHREALLRYGAVIYFDPPDERTFEEQKRANRGRIDRTYAETVALHEATFAAWRDHPAIDRVPFFPRWEEKLDYAGARLRTVLSNLPR